MNSDIAVGLLQGSYYVTTRDDLGCEVIDSIYISHPDPLNFTLFLIFLPCINWQRYILQSQ